MAFTKHDRIRAALDGRQADRPPVAAWKHLLPEERAEGDFVEASVAFSREYDWDWLKINPRAVYYSEIFGNIYDYDHYTGVLPRLVSSAIRSPADLSAVKPAGVTHPVIAEQLRVVAAIRKSLPDVPLIQTVFSPLSVLQFLVQGLAAKASNGANGAKNGSSPDADLTVLHGILQDHPRQAHDALSAITETLRNYAEKAVGAGADGVFFAIVRLAREGALTREEFQEFGKPYDLQALQGAKNGTFNVLHICGPRVFFDAAADYPVHAVNWAARGGVNPTLAEAQRRLDKAVMGGVDDGVDFVHTGPTGIRAQATAAIAGAGLGKFLLSPGCSVEVDTPAANLKALRAAVETVAAH